MGATEEPAAAGPEQAEQSVHDVILEMLEQDSELDSGVKDVVLDALAEVVGHAQAEVEAQTAPIFLTTISVAGFRGIGRQARLDLYPAPGLMVVSGRNGSGKSSFAEALELALTGTSYRWHKKEVLWAETWRNLHHSDPCAIRVGFTAEGNGPFTVGVNWASGAALTERTSWTQHGSEIEAVATRLRAADQAVAATTGNLAESTSQRVDLLQAALRFHDHAGDTDCPVCGEGSLDTEWAARTRDTIASSEEALGEYRAAASKLTQSRSAATTLLSRFQAVDAIAGVDLPALATYNEAVASVHQSPDGDTELAAHLESASVAAADIADTLRAQAGDALELRESSWAPLAAQLGGWLPMEGEARSLDGTVKTMTVAKKWMADHVGAFRNLRLEPIAAQARTIWGQLRQESNVDLGDITLEGTATRRRAILSGSVDGQPTKALSVMSQGELHALALALFLPRATAADSPFRFVVLDDPIQAMDPAKIDGFVQVLSEVAQTHQVIVFSHDDRLASVIRETGVDARLLEVVRETESKLTIRDNVNPALRAVNDIFALIKDDRLPDEIRARVLPGLFRVAVESAAKQAYYTKESLAGRARTEFEQAWMSTKKTMARLALAVHGDPGADLKGWLDAKPERRPTLRLCNAVHGEALGVATKEARELERTVEAVLALR
jgi:energy-coupling factor transporter ATP-binding protein EcfA2